MPGIRKNGVALYSYKKEKKKDGNKKAPQIPYGISNFVRMRTEIIIMWTRPCICP